MGLWINGAWRSLLLLTVMTWSRCPPSRRASHAHWQASTGDNPSNRAINANRIIMSSEPRHVLAHVACRLRYAHIHGAKANMCLLEPRALADSPLVFPNCLQSPTHSSRDNTDISDDIRWPAPRPSPWLVRAAILLHAVGSRVTAEQFAE